MRIKTLSLKGIIFSLLICTSLLTQAQGLPDFTQLVKDSAPAVVNISTTQKIDTSNRNFPSEMPDFFRDFFGEIPEFHRRQPQKERQSLGSGFIISSDGYLLTNNHVVENASEVLVRLSDRRELIAEIIGTDPSSDLALLKVEAKNLPVVKIGNSDDLEVGEWVLAIGSPFGFDHSVTAGIVSAIGRALPRETYVPFIQTDVAINPGNSGGPLFNLKGEVVGINSQIYTRSGGFMGLSFAIPMQMALEVSEQLKQQGRVSRGWLGVAIQDVNLDLAISLGLDKPQGALIASIDAKGPGAKGGLKVGDLILSVNKQAIIKSSDLPPAIGRVRPGDTANLTILRNGKQTHLKVKIGEREDQQQITHTKTKQEPVESNRLGLTLEDLSANLKQRFKLEQGVVVAQVTPNSPAAAAGIRRGDVLVNLDGQEITNLTNLTKQIKNLSAKKPVALRLIREGNPIFVAIKPE